MANEEHLRQLQRGVEPWNKWVRSQRIKGGTPTRHEGAKIGASGFGADLNGADLSGLDLYEGKEGAGFSGIDLIGADLREANLSGTKLAWANLTGATLSGANLRNVSLNSARAHGANLSGVDLSEASIVGADFLMANLSEATLTGAYLYETVFSDTNLTGAVGLNACQHLGPCTIDHRTLFGYQQLPRTFLRGCGLPERFVGDPLVLHEEPVEFYSCFISHSSQDREFVKRLHDDLQDKGVRCWYAPEHLGIGARMWDTFDTEIEKQDKVLVICSSASIESKWVEDEVTKAFAEERHRGKLVILPIRIDDAIWKTKKPWVTKIIDNRNIGDFTCWENHKGYKKAFRKLLENLRTVSE